MQRANKIDGTHGCRGCHIRSTAIPVLCKLKRTPCLPVMPSFAMLPANKAKWTRLVEELNAAVTIAVLSSYKAIPVMGDAPICCATASCVPLVCLSTRTRLSRVPTTKTCSICHHSPCCCTTAFAWDHCTVNNFLRCHRVCIVECQICMTGTTSCLFLAPSSQTATDAFCEGHNRWKHERMSAYQQALKTA